MTRTRKVVLGVGYTALVFTLAWALARIAAVEPVVEGPIYKTMAHPAPMPESGFVSYNIEPSGRVYYDEATGIGYFTLGTCAGEMTRDDVDRKVEAAVRGCAQ